MKSPLLAAVAAALLSASASAQLRIFFATTGAGELEPLSASPALENPQVLPGEPLYVYAQMFGGPESWNGVSLDIDVRGGGLITGWQFYNYANDPFLRWDYVEQGSLTNADTRLTDALGLACLDGFGVQNDPQYDTLDLHYRRDVDATLLGWITVVVTGQTGEAEVFLGIGGYGITKAGTSVPQDIYLGFGDEGDGLTGESVHQFSSQADATVSCAGFVRADANCDGDVNAFDIDPFVLALTEPAGYQTQFPGCHRLCTCDIDRDGVVTSFDIDPFIECITGGCP